MPRHEGRFLWIGYVCACVYVRLFASICVCVCLCVGWWVWMGG